MHPFSTWPTIQWIPGCIPYPGAGESGPTRETSCWCGHDLASLASIRWQSVINLTSKPWWRSGRFTTMVADMTWAKWQHPSSPAREILHTHPIPSAHITTTDDFHFVQHFKAKTRGSSPLFSNHEASFIVSADSLVTEKAATLSQDREKELNTASANHVATALHTFL